MEQDKTLRALFEQLEKNAPDLMSVEEVEQKIGRIQPAPIKSYKKIITVMGILTSIAIATYTFLSQQPGTPEINRISPFTTIAPEMSVTAEPENSRTSVADKSLKSTPSSAVVHEVKDGIHAPVVPLYYYPLNDAENPNDPMQATGVAITSPDPVTPFLQNTTPCLRLNAEELFKLGIVGKDGGIFYEETFDHQRPFKFSMVIQGRRLSVNNSGGDKAILSHPDKYPFLITDKYLSMAHSMLNRKELKDTIELFNHYKNYIPVIVSNQIVDPQPLYPNELIFWFPKSEYIISLMPQWVQDGLAKNPDAYAWDMKTGREYRPALNMQTKTVRSEVLITDPEKIDMVGQGAVICPDEQLFKNLGFYYDKEQHLSLDLKYKKFFYKVYRDGMTMKYLSDCPSKDYFAKVQEQYDLPVPYYISDSLCDRGGIHSLATGNDGRENILQSLINTKHLMTPVRVNIGPMGSVKYLWYMNNSKFLKALNPEQMKIAQTIMKDSLKNKMVMEIADISTDQPAEPNLREIYKLGQQTFDKVNAITIDPSETEMLGYKVVDHDLRLFIPSRGMDTGPGGKTKPPSDGVSATVLTHTRYGTEIGEVILSKNLKQMILPVYISDDLGKHTYISIIEDSSNGSPIQLNKLIPVLVKTGRSYSAVDLSRKAARPDYLLWYQATPEFLNLLPKQVKEDIQKEMKTEVKDTAKMVLPCKYTDVCKQRTEAILNANAYPNPVRSVLNIDLKLKSVVSCTISLADLSGKLVLQKIWTPEALSATTSIETGALESGIYYLYIHTAEGDLIVQKILVSHD